MKAERAIVQLSIPDLLNTLYTPLVKYVKGKPVVTFIKSKSSKEYKKYVQVQCMRQKVKKISSKKISVRVDILLNKRRDFDIDAVLKLLLDSLECVYENDRYVVELIVRKHLNEETDGLVVEIKDLNFFCDKS